MAPFALTVAGERLNVGAFSAGQRAFLEFHRERVFLEAAVERGTGTRGSKPGHAKS